MTITMGLVQGAKYWEEDMCTIQLSRAWRRQISQRNAAVFFAWVKFDHVRST